MFIKEFNIRNFKSFQDVTFHFNPEVNVLTGKNNTGKTTVLEALALWHECFYKLLQQRNGTGKAYKKGFWVLGDGGERYFPFEQIISVKSPNFEDIFHQRERKNKIRLAAILSEKDADDLPVTFEIGESGLSYSISLVGYEAFDFNAFNNYFEFIPDVIGLVYAAPIAGIRQIENFQTAPQIKDAVLKKESYNVIRNRLYRMLRGGAADMYSFFQQDLSYVLFNSNNSIEFDTPSDFNRDIRVVVNFLLERRDTVEKDIALLGSGSLQVIEILLNLHQPGESEKDFSIILLDEPDSHIHRDIQLRLMDIINKRAETEKSQIFLTSHNESLIRCADHHQLFHLEGNPVGVIRDIESTQVAKIQPRFKGIYPSHINPVIRAIGSVTGLDFVNAIEADRLIFVEGEDDARILNYLFLRQQVINRKKYMFWVLGGISEMFEHIPAYQRVFSAIKNGKTLWERSTLIFDKDCLSAQHQAAIVQHFRDKLKINCHSWSAYTLESTVFTNLHVLTDLLAEWVLQLTGNPVDKTVLWKDIEREYLGMKALLEQRYGDAYIEHRCWNYRDLREKANTLFKEKVIRQEDIPLTTYFRNYVEHAISSGKFYELMTKDDSGDVIAKVLHPYGLSFSIETDFIELIKLVNKSMWLDEWDFINSL